MNDFELRQLIRKIEEKFEKRIEALENEIALLKETKEVSTPIVEKQNNQLLNYYLNRYTSEAEIIKKLRLEGIIQELNEVNIDYENIKNQLQNLEQLSLDYEKNVETAEELKRQLDDVYL